MLSACAEYEDFKSLYSMLPDLKSGRTLSKGTRSMRLAPPHSPCSQQTDGLRSSLLAFKTKWRKKGQNKSAQGNALGIVRNQHSPRMGKRIIIPLTPFATLQWWAVILLPPSGAYPCCILSPRALPGAGISMPLRGVNLTKGQDTHIISDRRTKGHDTPPTPILRQAKRLRRLPQGRGV